MEDKPHDLQYLKGVAKEIALKLREKEFEVISFHSRYYKSPRVAENRRLRGDDCIKVDGTTVRILLEPRRTISFDVADDPSITFESDRQIQIVRHFVRGDVMTQIILLRPE
jgi:hypothetical protein